MDNNIFVIGGTGNIGTPLVKLLKESSENFKVLARSDENEAKLSAEGISVLRGELGDWKSVEDKLAGFNTIFLLSSPSPEMPELHQGLIDRAKSSGVRKIVRLSAEPARESEGLPMYEHHAKVDEYLANSGIDYVILRPHYFMQNILQMHASYIKEQQMFAQFLGDGRIPMVDTRDVADAAFRCLTSDDHNGEILYITGPRAISYYDVAEAFSNSLGKNIQYVSLPFADQKAGLEAYGIPPMIVETVMTLFQRWADSGERPASTDFETLTARKAIDIDQFASDYARAL